MTHDERAIRELIHSWMRATESGDVARVLELMDDDVVFIGPGRPPMRGKQAFAQASQAAGGRQRIEGSAEVQEVHVFGEWAYCWNQLTVRMTPLDGGPASEMSGPVLSIFRRRPDGVWVLFRDANMITRVGGP
jgi:uncharacterized protein (TIGR02246 family)